MSCPMGLITPFHIKFSTLYYESRKGVPFWGRNVDSACTILYTMESLSFLCTQCFVKDKRGLEVCG